MATCEHYRELLSGLLDNELRPEESADLNTHLIRCASCRADYEDLRRTSQKLEAISFVEITDAAAESLWKLPFARFLKVASLLLVIGGYAGLLAYGVVLFFAEDRGEPIPRMMIAAIIIGLLVLLAALIIERLRTYRVDPYREIDR